MLGMATAYEHCVVLNPHRCPPPEYDSTLLTAGMGEGRRGET
jgi:hypothetical protein